MKQNWEQWPGCTNTPGNPRTHLKNEDNLVNATDYCSMVSEKYMYLAEECLLREQIWLVIWLSTLLWKARWRTKSLVTCKNCEDGIKLTFCKPEKLRSAVSTGSGYYSKSMIDQLQCAGECTICLALWSPIAGIAGHHRRQQVEVLLMSLNTMLQAMIYDRLVVVVPEPVAWRGGGGSKSVLLVVWKTTPAASFDYNNWVTRSNTKHCVHISCVNNTFINSLT
jgi:hypothetical protein